ncbi:fatty acid desaturase [Roseivirga sp. BDSF3-8]|uniref:fatty acid desaturase family protein n=1 Tax=Roseivirga sp. BDSF3-8 TaxID=3241598 RepID=UPI0035322A3F
MALTNIRFKRPAADGFSKTLRNRVNHYFSDNLISKNGNANMVTKTVFIMSLYLVPIFILYTGLIESAWLIFALYMISGIGMAGVGMNVMHDAIHGSYTKSSQKNRWLGYTMNLIGANATVWKIQHNVLHHTYTNIEGHDDDINPPWFLRFSPNSRWNAIHKYQHLYTWFFYGLSTISWITSKDFVRLTRYKKLGFVKGKNAYRNTLIKVIGWKALYFFYTLILPIILLPVSPLVVIGAFLTMHFMTGLIISVVFQTAHVMPETEFNMPDHNDTISEEWLAHQVRTTANYCPRSKVFSWLIGGLNYQIEHHLFPNICHVHYEKISQIVRTTAEEFDIPYQSYQSFGAALKQHYRMLRVLGNARANSLSMNN